VGVILILFFTLIPFVVYSQNKILRFDHITSEDGLSQNTVSRIVKDKYGFIWFATNEGINKYDGYKFTIYTTDQGDPKSIYDNRIFHLFKDNDETIWIGWHDTTVFCRYNYETDDFTRISSRNVPKKISDSLSSRGFYYSFIKTNDFIWYVFLRGNILSLNVPANKVNNLLTQTNCKTGQQYTYRTNPLDHWALSDEVVSGIYFDDNDILWVGTFNGGINKADTRQKPFYYYQHTGQNNKSIIDNNIRAICVDNLDNLWIGTDSKGITKIDRKNNTYIHYQHNEKDPANSLINNHVRKIYCDRFGYMWFGTIGGLDRFDPKTDRFSHYTTSSKSTIPHNLVFSIMEDYKGYLWIGTWNGIAKYNRENDRFYGYLAVDTIKINDVRVIYEDRKKNIWIATEGEGIIKLQRKAQTGFLEKFTPTRYVNVPDNSNSLISNSIYTLIEDNQGILWAGTSNGLTLFDPVKSTFTCFNKKNGMPDELTVGLVKDNNGNIWVSHKKGLTRINPKTFEVRSFNKLDGLLSNDFSEDAYFVNEKTGELFFGTSNGFSSFFPDSLKENPFLPKVVFTELQIQDTPVLLNKKYNGRIILDKPIYMTKEISLTHWDKTFSIEFAALHYSNPKDNKYAHMLEGFDRNWIYTDATKRVAVYANLEPKTYVLKVKASNNDGIWNPVPTEITIIVLPAYWQTWWFKLIVLLIFIASIYIAYYLRVALYRKNQKELSLLVKQRTREISQANDVLLERQTRIEEYAEELRTHTENLREANDLLIDKQKLIEIQADQLKDTNEQLSVLNSTKDRFFSIIAHDLRNPFHTVSGFAEVLIKDYKKLPPEKIEKYLNLIYASSASGNNLLENLLQWSRTQTGRIAYEPTKLNLLAIAEETINMLEGDILRKNITTRQLIGSNITVFADENMLKTIFRNLVSNAIKFSHENGTITLKSAVIDQQVEVTVADTGVGIPQKTLSLLFRIDATVTTKGTANETGTGLGLILCKEFVEKHQGVLSVESETDSSRKDKGSKFKFTLPLG